MGKCCQRWCKSSLMRNGRGGFHPWRCGKGELTVGCTMRDGVVHTNVGQKLLNCFPLRVFSGDQ